MAQLRGKLVNIWALLQNSPMMHYLPVKQKTKLSGQLRSLTMMSAEFLENAFHLMVVRLQIVGVTEWVQLLNHVEIHGVDMV